MKTMKKLLPMLLIAVMLCVALAGCLSSKIKVTYYVGEEEYLVQEYEMNEEIKLPEAPKAEGKSFVGWYTDAELTTPYTTGAVTYAMKLYAKFNTSTVFIVINPNGGTIENNRIELVPGGSYTLPTPVKEGYTFTGYTYFDGTSEKDFAISGTYSGTQSIQVTAKYTANKYSVTFKDFDTDATISTLTDVAHGAKVEIPAAIAGYEFVSAFKADKTAAFNAASDTITASTTLYVKYQPKTFTITVNGAQQGYVNPQVQFGAAYTLVAPDRGANYVFVGFEKDGQPFAATGTYTWTENITVEAIWEGDGRDIIFYDGNTEVGRIEKLFGDDITGLVLMGVPAKPGYNNDGKWYTDAACTTEFVPTGVIENNISLYAKYTPITYTVLFSVWDSTAGAMTLVPVNVAYGDVIVPPTPATRAEYVFAGYTLNGEAFDITKPFTRTESVTIVEKWNERVVVNSLDFNASGNYFTEKKYEDDDPTIVLLNGVSTPYTFSGVTMTFKNPDDSRYAAISGGTIQPLAIGSFDVVITPDGSSESYVRTMKIVETVRSFGHGSNYTAAWSAGARETTAWKDIWENETKGDIMDAGRQNFIPELTVLGATANVTVDKVNAIVKVYVDGNLTSDWTGSASSISFGESLKGKVVTLKIRPKYAPSSSPEEYTATYTLQLNEGVNVYGNDDLKANFADSSVLVINVLRNIEAALDESQIVSVTTDSNGYANGYFFGDMMKNTVVTAPFNYTGLGGAGIYQRTYGDLQVNGNYFSVNTSHIPLVDNRVDGLSLLDHPGGVTENVHLSVFRYGVRINYVGTGNENTGTLNMENLNVIGNVTGTSLQTAPYTYKDKAIYVNSGALIGLQCGSGTVNLDNVTLRRGAFGLNGYGEFLNAQGSHAVTIYAKDCNISNNWSNNSYLSGYIKATFDSCYLGAANGSTLHVDANAHPTVNAEIYFENDNVIENWVVGTEPWFVIFGIDGAMPSFKAGVNAAVEGWSGGSKTIIKSAAAGTTVNFVLIAIETGDGWATDDGNRVIINKDCYTVNMDTTVSGDVNSSAFTRTPYGPQDVFTVITNK